ncbi:hypothetical protein Tco_0289542 [Tanacetum coccineum]
MYHHTGSFTCHEREIYKSLMNRLFHEGRVVLPDFLESKPNLRTTFVAIGFDCLLDINEQIFPIFVLQFYKSVRLIRNLNGTLCIGFVIDNVETVLTLENFGRILRISYEGVCLYCSKWSISSLQRSCDPHPNHYPPPYEDPSVVRDALFHLRTEPKTRTIKSDSVTLEPFQMINNELRENFKKWEIILSDNAISLTGHKDHPNVSLCYMLYSLATGKPFNLAYFIAHRMVNHVMIPLSSKIIYRFKNKGKRIRLPTLTPSNSSGSSQSPPNQGTSTNPSGDPIDNYTLDPVVYLNQLPPIEGGESPEFKQTKGLFKYLFHFLCKKK